MFSRSLTHSLRLRGTALAMPARRVALATSRSRSASGARGYAAVQKSAASLQLSSVRAATYAAGRVSYCRYFSTEESHAAPDDAVTGEAAPSGLAAEEGQTGGPFRVTVTGVPAETLNRDVRIFLSRAGHVCWIRRVRAEQNEGKALVIVEYLTEDEAQAAISTLNGEQIDGETVQVEPDTSGLVMQLPSRLVLKNLPYTYDEFQIRELVSDFDVSWVNLIMNDRGFSGMATVKFSSQQEAKSAMVQLINSEADGRRLIPSFQGSTQRGNDRAGQRRRGFNDREGGDGFRPRGNRSFENRGGYEDQGADRQRRSNNMNYFGDE